MSRAVLLCNLGSPDSPSVPDVRRYLGEFLMDGYVLDIPYLIRRLIVSGFILPRRPKQSAKAYRSIWWTEGSPLVVISQRVRDQLAERLDEPVALAMRYGNPSIGDVIDQLVGDHPQLDEILLVPLYPHYALSSSTTVEVAVRAALDRRAPSIRMTVVPPFFADPGYIAAMVEGLQEALESNPDHVLFSYHGLPERHIRKADPTGAHCLASSTCCVTPSPAHDTCYRHQVLKTTELVARGAGLGEDRYSISFQSRLGRDRWLLPDTVPELERLAREGVGRLLVLCPAFVSDCLETLEEIGIRGRATFTAAGGTELELAPCLNERSRWIDALANLCRADTTPASTTPVADAKNEGARQRS